MATKASQQDAFVKGLKKVYAFYTLGFLAFVIVLAVLEQMGMGPRYIGWIFMAATILLYAVIGVWSRTTDLAEYYVAGRRVPALFNGMATGADWMSAASFMGMAGSLYLEGYDGLAWVMGWTGGYVLVAVFLAPYLRKFGQFTIPDFLGERYGGNMARIIGIVAAITASFTYVVAQLFGVGLVTSKLLELNFEVGVFVGLAGVLVCSFLGGMRAVTWTQVAQYIILIIAYWVPVVWMSWSVTGNPIPQLAYGDVLRQIGEYEAKFGITKNHVTPFVIRDTWNFLALTFVMMAGTAALPHILMRYYTTPNVREARLSVGYSLFFIFLLYFTAPAYAAFAKLEVFQNVVGLGINNLPAWVQTWGKAGWVTVTDFNADGILQWNEIALNTNAIVVATPEIAGLPYVVTGLVMAGGLAAALSTADGLLLTIANALSHDLYYKILDPKASTIRRLVVARTLLLIVAVIAAFVATKAGAWGILAFVAYAFSIASAAFLPALVMGIFWKRATTVAANLGMSVGFLICMYYLLATSFIGTPAEQLSRRWFNTAPLSSGVFGIAAGFIIIWLVSYVTKAPDQKTQDMIESVRYPRLG
jgi:cation/acetate symporter